ncbi:hypothetical protein MRX96_054104 [Rhipicephalus microplus]
MDAVIVPSTSSTHYLDFMTNRWIPRFGVPSVIITDQAKGFVNKKTNQFHHRLGIAHQSSPPCWTQSNGLIERMVRTLKQVLRKMLNNKGQTAQGTTPSNASNQRHEASSQWPQPISTSCTATTQNCQESSTSPQSRETSTSLIDCTTWQAGTCGVKGEGYCRVSAKQWPDTRRTANSEVHNGGPRPA